MDINHWIKTFLTHLEVERNYSHHTQINYEVDLRQFLEFLQDEFQIDEIAPEEIQRGTLRRYLSKLLHKKYSARSVQRKLASLRAFFKFLVREGALQHSPATSISFPKVDKPLPHNLTQDEIRDVLSLPELTSPSGVRDHGRGLFSQPHRLSLSRFSRLGTFAC